MSTTGGCRSVKLLPLPLLDDLLPVPDMVGRMQLAARVEYVLGRARTHTQKR
jgi:hypothetical protein